MIQPVILSGGSGTRLWPLSREVYPKQLLPLNSDLTMLQETVVRLDGMADGADPVLLVLPADHLIKQVNVFQQAVAAGLALALNGKLVTFGIVPDKPETGYGYIRAGKPLEYTRHSSIVPGHLFKTKDQGQGTKDAALNEAYAVVEFVEKPDQATAQSYHESGDYYWNSGMFMFKASRFLDELERFNPQMLEACQAAQSALQPDLDFMRLDADLFAACPSDSIDYAVMEKTADAVVIPLDAGWSDIGSWSALWEVGEKDAVGNLLRGDVMVEDVRNCYFHSESRLIAGIGLENLVVVDTKDALLIADKDRVQDVKKIVDTLKKQQRSEASLHRRVNRPWGDYESLNTGDRFQVKLITVKPGASSSLQIHYHRSEHWVVVKGTANLTCGDETRLVSENESIYIPVGSAHRIENPGKLPLELIEVQTGSYLGEDDIVRIEDQYGR